MALFDDMTTELSSYPIANVKLEIIDVTFPGNALNAREEGTFRIKVSNTGPLNLNNVQLRVSGQNGATVAPAAVGTGFASDFVTGAMATIGGHVGFQFMPDDPARPLRFKAPNGRQPSKDLIAATLEAWDADLDHILNGHSDALPTAPKGVFAAEVIAS